MLIYTQIFVWYFEQVTFLFLGHEENPNSMEEDQFADADEMQ